MDKPTDVSVLWKPTRYSMPVNPYDLVPCRCSPELKEVDTDGGIEMKYLTYLIYIVLWEGMVFGWTGYAVFVLGHSGWWFALAILLGEGVFRPEKWFPRESN